MAFNGLFHFACVSLYHFMKQLECCMCVLLNISHKIHYASVLAPGVQSAIENCDDTHTHTHIMYFCCSYFQIELRTSRRLIPQKYLPLNFITFAKISQTYFYSNANSIYSTQHKATSVSYIIINSICVCWFVAFTVSKRSEGSICFLGGNRIPFWVLPFP